MEDIDFENLSISMCYDKKNSECSWEPLKNNKENEIKKEVIGSEESNYLERLINETSKLQNPLKN